MAVNNAVRMDLCIECSPAVQEVPGSIPTETLRSQMFYAEDVGGPGQAPTVCYLLGAYSQQIRSTFALFV